MNDDERDLAALSRAEEELARRLAQLGPVMSEQDRIEAELDQSFARNLRSQLLQEGTARPARRPARRRFIPWIGATTTAFLLLLAAALVFVLMPRGAHVPSFSAPYPTRADLTFGFPAPPVEIHRLTPTASLVNSRPGIPYAGHLRLRAGRLPKGTPSLLAYRLAPPSDVIFTERHLLSIRSPVRYVVAGATTWIVAADGGSPSHKPLHSLAVSLASGELIYHDRRNLVLPRATRALRRSAAVTVARRWLVRLGWPGSRMPLIAIENVRNLPHVQEVEFGWIGVGAAATDAATLWVTPNKSVIEAWVWPPVTRAGRIAARPIAAALIDVQQGKLPLAVEGVPPTTRADGAGAVRHTSIVSILSSRNTGTLYLVPTYRFAGKAEIPGTSVHTWYSLAPCAQK